MISEALVASRQLAKRCDFVFEIPLKPFGTQTERWIITIIKELHHVKLGKLPNIIYDISHK